MDCLAELLSSFLKIYLRSLFVSKQVFLYEIRFSDYLFAES